MLGECIRLDEVMDTTENFSVGRVHDREYTTAHLKKWVAEIWGKIVNSLLLVMTMTRGWFTLRFHRSKHVTSVLSKYCHIKMIPILLKWWSLLFDTEHEQLGAGPIWVRLLGLPLQFWTKDVFKCVGNYIGIILDFEKYFQESGKRAYAHILVHLGTREELVESLRLQWQGIIRL